MHLDSAFEELIHNKLRPNHAPRILTSTRRAITTFFREKDQKSIQLLRSPLLQRNFSLLSRYSRCPRSGYSKWLLKIEKVISLFIISDVNREEICEVFLDIFHEIFRFIEEQVKIVRSAFDRPFKIPKICDDLLKY